MGRSHERRHAPEVMASDEGLTSSAGMVNEFYQGWAPGMAPGRIAVGRFPSATGGQPGHRCTPAHPIRVMETGGTYAMIRMLASQLGAGMCGYVGHGRLRRPSRLWRAGGGERHEGSSASASVGALVSSAR